MALVGIRVGVCCIRPVPRRPTPQAYEKMSAVGSACLRGVVMCVGDKTLVLDVIVDCNKTMTLVREE